MRLVPAVPGSALEHLEPKLLERANHADTMHAIDQLLSALGLNRSHVTVSQVGIQLEFLSDGRRKGKTLTFNVSYPNSCDLKSKPDDVRVVGERSLKRWGILPGTVLWTGCGPWSRRRTPLSPRMSSRDGPPGFINDCSISGCLSGRRMRIVFFARSVSATLKNSSRATGRTDRWVLRSVS